MVALNINSCQLFEPYKPIYVRGNLIKPDELQQIQTGLNQKQVENILGSPMLTNIFSNNPVWEYVLDTNDKDVAQKHIDYVRLEFDKNGYLIKIDVKDL